MQKIVTKDGSFTLKNLDYNECYHSSEGALRETLYKHIYPAFSIIDYIRKDTVKILDICFGLGYNTFLSILNRPKNKKLEIYSPELDINLIKSLKYFEYPRELNEIQHIINAISNNYVYEDENLYIEVYRGDARNYIKSLTDIDIVYQDAFSPKVNTELWTIEYFRDIDKLNPKIITTYSVASPIRYALYLLGYNLYTHPYSNIRKGTLFSKLVLDFPKVDFEEKLKRIEAFYYEDKNEI